MNVQTTPAAIALAPLQSGQRDDRSFGTNKTDNAGAPAASTSVLPDTTPTFALAVTWTKRSSLPWRYARRRDHPPCGRSRGTA
jgi:hypothetical protein